MTTLTESGIGRDIQLSGVTKSFGDLEVLRDITLDVGDGEVVVLIGASGSGKSTLLRIMSGLETATTGEVVVGGVPMHDPKRAPEIRGHVGMVFQQFNLFPHLDAIGNVTLALRKVYKMSKEQANAKGMEVLARVGMDERAHHFPSQLSGGQQQRVAIARALAVEPRLVVMDEPVSALDVSVQQQVLRLIASLQRDTGAAFLFISHDLGVIRQVSHAVAVLQAGALREIGTADQVLTHPRDPYTRELLAAVARLPA